MITRLGQQRLQHKSMRLQGWGLPRCVPAWLQQLQLPLQRRFLPKSAANVVWHAGPR